MSLKRVQEIIDDGSVLTDKVRGECERTLSYWQKMKDGYDGRIKTMKVCLALDNKRKDQGLRYDPKDGLINSA